MLWRFVESPRNDGKLRQILRFARKTQNLNKFCRICEFFRARFCELQEKCRIYSNIVESN
ncbi:hypothetical protein ACWIUD_11900 [Helicobacter sp. 23-1044]